MAETPRTSDVDHETPPRMPRWVRVAAIVVGLLILTFLVLKLTGIGGDHGPSRHMSGAPAVAVSTSGGQNAPAVSAFE